MSRNAPMLRGWMIAVFGLVSACTVPKLGDLGALRCDGQHACLSGFTCVDEVCVPTLDAGPDRSDAGSDRMDAGPDSGPDTTCSSGSRGAPEICNGEDDDCDGRVDILSDGGALLKACPLTKGVCAGAVQACTAGAFSATCEASAYGPKYEPFERACDGLDNDCDGRIDVSREIELALGGADLQEFDIAVSQEGFRVVYVDGQVSNSVKYQRFDPDWNPIGTAVSLTNGTFLSSPKIMARGDESLVTFQGYRSSTVVGLLARIDSAGRHLFTEGTGGQGRAVFVPAPDAPVAELKAVYSSDRQSVFAFWLDESGIVGARYSLDGLRLATQVVLGSPVTAGTLDMLDVAPQKVRAFLVAARWTDPTDGKTHPVVASVSEVLELNEAVPWDSPGAPTGLLLFPDVQSPEGASLAWLAEDDSQSQIVSITRAPLSAPGAPAPKLDLGFREITLLGAAGTDAGTSVLTLSPSSSNGSLYKTDGPPMIQSYLAGELEGFRGKGHVAAWASDERAWWIGYIAPTTNRLRVARVCGP